MIFLDNKLLLSGQCFLCSRSPVDEGGGLLVKHLDDPDSESFVLFFCLDCLDDRLEEVNETENKIIEQNNLVRFC